jgi:hypothetical protein
MSVKRSIGDSAFEALIVLGIFLVSPVFINIARSQSKVDDENLVLVL